MEAGPKSTRRKRACTSSSPRCSGEPGLPASPLPRVVLLPAEPSHRSRGSMQHSHAQRVSGLCDKDAGRAKVVAKVGRDGSGDAGTHVLARLRSRSRRLLDGSGQVRRVDSKFLRSPRALKGYRRLEPGLSRGPLPRVAAAAMMGVALVAKDEEFAVVLVIQYVAFLRPSEMSNLTAGQVIRHLQGSGASSWALLLAPQDELKASKTAKFSESVLLDGHLSVPFGKVLTRYTAGKTAATLLWTRSQARYALNFAKRAKTSGVNEITTHPYSVRYGVREIQNEADGTARKASGGTNSTPGCSRKPRSCRQPRENLDNW